jgi:hypothetical protein
MRECLAVVALGMSLFFAAATVVERAAANDHKVTWCWGSQRRSENVAFLRITTSDSKVIVETKDYMHSKFVADTKDVVFAGGHLEFSYWYKPLARWAHCSLTAGPTGDTMAGSCDGELGVGNWTRVPSYLWRC